ncbi:MAG TPA: hypothetical protein VGO16_02465 [Pseudonocardiaceae bacterium]|nr:hypothetical protein [Pseudonocardiaceae bacterium]
MTTDPTDLTTARLLWVGAARQAQGWNCGCGYRPCSGATSTLASWPVGDPCTPTLARDLATTLACGQWRFAITDEQGQLLHCGITRARPTETPTRSAHARQIVELQIPATTLCELASAPAR